MKNSTTAVRGLLAGLAAAATMGAARAADPAPTFQNLRYNDSQETRRQDLIYMKLGPGEASSLAVGGQARVRGEWWENFNFGADHDDEFLLTRLRLHGDLRVAPGLRFFVEGRSALANGRDLPTPDGSGKRPADEDVVDLQNAFGDLSFSPTGESLTTLRVGRQELSYGKERVLGVADWANTRRTFDAAKLMLEDGGWQLDAFAARLVPVQRYEFNDGDSGQDLYGVYSSGRIEETAARLDLYWLLRNKEAVAGGPDDERHTVGVRLYGACGTSAFDYDLEGDYQFGDRGEAGIEAWAAAAQLGYLVPDCPVHSRLFLGADYATGDDDLQDADATRYDQLYPTGHAFLGLIDVIGRQNILAFSAGITAEPAKKIKTKLEGHWFERAESGDGVFDAAGNQVIAGGASDASGIGQEADFTIGYQHNARLLLAAGYGHFFAGDVVNDAGGEDIDTAYLSGQYTF